MKLMRMSLLLLTMLAALVSSAQETPNTQPQKPDSAAFSVTDANQVVALLRQALEAHSQRKFFALYDAGKMSDYLSFQDQVESFFSHNDNIRANAASIQSSMEGDKGIITATIQMELTPRVGNIVRRETQLRIELERAGQRWLIVNIDPRTFFS